jgi:hypothetical protein
MPSGTRRLGRKRFAEAVKYLKTVIADDTRSDKMRMAAIESLIAIFDRNDRTTAQLEQRRRKDAEAAQGASPAPEMPEAQESAEERAEAFLRRIRAERGDTSEQ